MQHAQALDRAIHSEAHKRHTAQLTAQYHARVEEWMERTLAAPVPPLHPKPLSQAAIDAAPQQFYRAPSLEASFRGPGSFGRGGGGADEDGSSYLPDHVQMSPRRYQTEAERLAAYEASDAHRQRVGHDPYHDPMPYEYRTRQKHAEMGGNFVFRPQNERARISEAISARDVVGTRAFPYEESKQHPLFRTEQKDKWHGRGHFSARLPSLPLFSREARVEEPYVEPLPLDRVFRHTDPNATLNPSTSRFSAQVPSDRFLPSPRYYSNPDAAAHGIPPVSNAHDKGLTHTLGAGLTSSGIYGPAFELDLSRAQGYAGRAHNVTSGNGGSSTGRSPRRRGGAVAAAELVDAESMPVAKTYWKMATTLAHHPGGAPVVGASSSSSSQRAGAAPNNGSQTARVRSSRNDADTAQQLYRTYRRHLNY
jgi:hypothetical protein